MDGSGESDLLTAIKESFVKDGTMGRFKAQIRAKVIDVLKRETSNSPAPKVPEETRMINELLREYLVWNGYVYSEQVLAAESSQPTERMTRDVLTTKLGVLDDAKSAKIPLLYYIIQAFQMNEEYEDIEEVDEDKLH